MYRRALVVGLIFTTYCIFERCFRNLYMSTNEKSHEIGVMKIHKKCRNANYPLDPWIFRFKVPDEKVPWDVTFNEYQPVIYTHPSVYAAKSADPDIQPFSHHDLQFNKIDKKIDRTSFTGSYQISEEGFPVNPNGRTGIKGRGLLWRWGPNHAADPIITRWKLDMNKEKIVDSHSGKYILQFVAIKRQDTNEWAIPGGMVDPGEDISDTLKREFSEEALGAIGAFGKELEEIRTQVTKAFKGGIPVYQGYVDDPRNTDNAWMETSAVNFHDDRGNGLAKFKLLAGDDAIAVRWVDVVPSISLYANHRDFIALTAKINNAHWFYS